jgi:uncharacterized protein involved in exopolysaccharide biosynthesis
MQDSPMENPFQEKEIHISDYLMVLRKRKWLIILFFLLTLCVTIFVTYTAVPIYQSASQLIIDKEKVASPITGRRTAAYESYISEGMTFNTNIKMITSTPVIMETVKALKLDEQENDQHLEISFIRERIAQFKANLKLLLKRDKPDKEGPQLSLEERQVLRMKGLVQMVRAKISVNQIPETRLLTLTVKDKSPRLAADIANMVAQKYIEFTLTNKMNSSKQTLEWLNNELYELRKKLEDDEKNFFEYKQANKVFSIKGKQKLAENKIQEFNKKYLDTRNKRLELDTKISELKKNIKGVKGVANVRSLINNPMIENMYAKIVDLEIELTRLSKIYKSKHPKIVQIKSELDKSEKRMALEIQKERENLTSQRKVLYAKEKILEKNIIEFEKDALDTTGKELKYTIYQRNVNTSQNLYDLMVARVKESDVLQTADSSNIRLVETAQVPYAPVSPNKKRNIMMGIVLGLFGGCGLAFFLEYLDQTIRTEEDIQEHFNLPVLSVIPKADNTVS